MISEGIVSMFLFMRRLALLHEVPYQQWNILGPLA